MLTPAMNQKQSEARRQAVDAIAPLPRADALAARIVEFWTRDYLTHFWVVATLAALLIAYLTYLYLLGPVPSTVYGNDVFLLLDGGWRILNGQAPNHDFYLSMGPIIYMWAAAGLGIAHYSASGLTIGFLLFAALIVLFAFLISRTRMTAAGSILFSTYILLLCTGPMPLGKNPNLDLTYAMLYNRFGYGLLGIIFLIQLLTPRDGDEGSHSDWFAGIVTGLCLTVLFFLKITYFGVGALLVLLSTLAFADLRTPRRLLAIACGLLPTTVAMLAFLRFDIRALIADLLDTMHARSALIAHFGIGDVIELGNTSLIALALAVCFFMGETSAGRKRLWLFAALIYTLVAEAMLVRTNASQGLVRPLYVVLIFVLLANIGKIPAVGQESRAAFAAALVVLGLALIAPTFFDHFRSLALLTKYKTNAQLKAGAYRVEGDQLRDLAFYDNMYDEPGRMENGHFYTAYLNDGIDLLKEHSTSRDVVASLSLNNPFSYALLRKPAHAGSTWLLLDNNISAGHMLSNERMFGDATVVMVQKYQVNTHTTSDEFLARAYKPYLLSNFSFVAQSEWWRLYRRLPGH
jgi:hypothetical protein